MEQIDAAVIGAGVIGLAIARTLALSGRSVVILEREAGFGTVISARNSEVIHAGLHYPHGSLKSDSASPASSVCMPSAPPAIYRIAAAAS